MVYLRNILADHEIQVAQYYIKRRAYLAAAKRGEYVVEHYQGTPSVPEALAIMVKGYTYLDLNELADTAEQKLASNFPDYPDLDSAGELQFEEKPENRQPGWLSIVTFGLLGS